MPSRRQMVALNAQQARMLRRQMQRETRYYSRNSTYRPRRSQSMATEGIGASLRFALTPSSGIPTSTVSSGTVSLASASCELLKLTSSNTLILAGDAQDIYNPVLQAISGNTLISYIPASEDPQKRVAITESCNASINASYWSGADNRTDGATMNNLGATFTQIPYIWTPRSEQEFVVSTQACVQYTGASTKAVTLEWTGSIVSDTTGTVRLKPVIGGADGAVTTLNLTANVAQNFTNVSTFPTVSTNEIICFQAISDSGTVNITQLTGTLNITAFS